MAKAKKRKPRAQDLPGMEERAIGAIETKAEEYIELRDERIALNKQEVVAKDALKKVMAKHGKTTYRRNLGDEVLEIIVTPGKDDVKVNKKAPKKSE